jgi:Fe-S-cluster-containing hydrogenase component 2
MLFPIIKTVKLNENLTNYELHMLNRDLILHYDNSKCIDCGFCHRVCPITIYKGVELKKTAIGTPKQMNINSNQRVVCNTDNCVWCGMCSYICPGYTLELFIDGQKRNILVENGVLPEFEEEIRVLDNGQKVRKVVQGSIRITSTEVDTNIIDSFTKECAVGALSRAENEIIIDKDKCILCFKCTEASESFEIYKNIKVKVFRDRFKNVKGEISTVWNGIMGRVLGQEGKIKGIVNYSNNKIADSILRLMGLEAEKDSEIK